MLASVQLTTRTAIMQAAARMGRATGVHFNGFTYGILFAIVRLLNEAAEQESSMREMLNGAAALEAGHSHLIFAYAVLQRVSHARGLSLLV